MIKENVKMVLEELPENVTVVAAAKGQSIFQIEEATTAGIKVIGENYIREAEAKQKVIGNRVKWHLIGHLQKNKVKKAVKLFDMIETLDSIELAHILDEECKKINKIMPVLIEINSAGEQVKSGVLPEEAEDMVKEVLKLENLKTQGLMTMGPFMDEVEDVRPFFRKTCQLFDKIKNAYKEELNWVHLSMGMSHTYKIAIQEGANIVRIGTAIFGQRPIKK